MTFPIFPPQGSAFARQVDYVYFALLAFSAVMVLIILLPMFYFPASDLLLAIAICIGLGLLTGIFPAVMAMRLRVADALRRM